VRLAFVALAACTSAAPRAPARTSTQHERAYVVGETIAYRMHGVNDGRAYDAVARGVVARDEYGRFYEDFEWSDLVVEGKPIELTAAQRAAHERLSLDPRLHVSLPDLRAAHPGLIGPMLDLLTFYADLSLFARHPEVARVGDRARVPYGKPASWANPAAKLSVGEDAVDFELSITTLDRGAMSLLVQHIPPTELAIRAPAAWMRETTPNWVQVIDRGDGAYLAMVGRESFDVSLDVDAASGRLRAATMINPVEGTIRACSDAGLSTCEPPQPLHILRRIELTAIP
jgi:hypothetical protein